MVAGEHGNQKHETAKLRARIVQLRDEGLSFRDIGAEVNRDVAAVWHHYQKAMRDIPAPMVTAHAEQVANRREEQLRRIDLERETVMAIVAKSKRTIVTPSGKIVPDVEDDATVLAAIDRLVKLDDQEAKLLGLNAKVQVETSGDVTYRFIGASPDELV